MPATVKCIRCNKEIPTNEARRDISGFEHCVPCYEEVINPKPAPPGEQRTPLVVVQSNAATPVPDTRVALAAVNLSVGDWFSVIFKATIASVMVGIVLAIPVFILMALWRASARP